MLGKNLLTYMLQCRHTVVEEYIVSLSTNLVRNLSTVRQKQLEIPILHSRPDIQLLNKYQTKAYFIQVHMLPLKQEYQFHRYD